jgi:hypothetical protein
MRVSHEHEARLDTFIAKRIAGGWVAERTGDDLEAAYGTRARRRRISRAAAALPSAATAAASRELVRAALAASAAATRLEGRVPVSLGGRAASILGAWAFGVGGFLYRAGLPQPRYARLLDGSYFRQPQ